MLKQIYKNNKSDKENKMNKWMKLGLLVAIGIYVISPTDMLPGPVDDLIMMLLGLAANKKMSKNEKVNEIIKDKTFVEAYAERVD